MRNRWLEGAVGLLLALGVAACLEGCSQVDPVGAAKAIHAYMPTVSGLAEVAAAVAEALDPVEDEAIRAVSGRVRAELVELDAVSVAYASAPTVDGWTRLTAAVDRLVNDADAALMAASGIKNAESQARARIALSALDAAVHVVDGYVAAARSEAEAKAVAAGRAVKLEVVTREWNANDWERVEAARAGM